MKLRKLFAYAALAAFVGLPTVANADTTPVVINGSLIDWYYYGKDMHSSDIGWFQQSTGGGAWIDEEGVAHAAGAPNYGMMSLIIPASEQSKQYDKNRAFDPEFKIRNTVLYSNYGGLYMGGNEYYSFFGHEVDASSNIDSEYGSEEYEILVRKWTWDVNEDGSYHNIKYTQVGKLEAQPTDLTYDPLEDVVYGVFSVSTGEGVTGYKVGILDMNTFKVSKWISREAMSMGGELRTLACNSKGELFGTDAVGNIYYVSKINGQLVKVGNLGFKSQLRMMSATFDYRTDKMYWLGYVNNGKNSASTDGTNTTLSIADGGRDTGLYEITFNELGMATATLIGLTNFQDIDLSDLENIKVNKYGKFQMTGIYVDGSIVKHEKDLRIRIQSAPEQMTPGQAGKVTVNVKNIGTSSVRGNKYVVKLKINDTEVGVINNAGYNGNEDIYTADLQAGANINLTFDFTAPAQSGEAVVTAVVEFAEDEVTANNTANEAIFILTGKTLPTVTLSGEYNDAEESVILNWTKPNGHVLAGAEEFRAFSYTGLNDWTMVDGDKNYTQKFNNWNATVEFPNWNTPKAFIVMEPYQAGLSPDIMIGGEKFLPHSGNQYFAAFHSANIDTKTWADNDDYMVSPKLNGEKQTISFWAKSYRGVEAVGYETEAQCKETLEVLYTTQDVDMANIETLLKDGNTFQVALATFVVNDNAWEQYTAELPAGAKHFALHRNTKADDAFVMLIDDIEFTIASQEPTAYRVYANGQFAGEQPADVFSVKADGVDFKNEYYVTAVYDGLESAPSNTWSVKIEEAGDLVKGPDTYQIWKIDETKSSYMLYLNETFQDYTSAFKSPIGVGIDGTDIYIKGISLDKPDSWIKGQLNGSIATFPAGQFIGHTSYMSAQRQEASSGSDPVQPIVFAYDSEKKTLTLDASLGIIENDNTTNISGVYAYWDKLVLYQYAIDGVETIKADSFNAATTLYNLSGQKVNGSYKGMVIRNGKKYLMK
jgi:archaellum component FlaG (FlaF/FlaG flagellin family)